MKSLQTIIIAMVVLMHTNVVAQEYTLSIQPVLSKDKVVTTFQPLADYLTKQTGQQITIKAYKSFLTYWQKMQRAESFDLVLDAAHFTDYRIQNYDYTVLAKIPEKVSFSLVTHEDLLIYKSEELILKNVATVPSPGLGGIMFYEIFNDPSRLPREVTVNNSQEAVNAIADGRADAAIIPSPLVNNYEFLNTVMTTEQIPRMALSASPTVSNDVMQSIQKALINANQSVEGRLMLEKISLPGFVSTDNKEYFGFSRLLNGLFGYKPSVVGSL